MPRSLFRYQNPVNPTEEAALTGESFVRKLTSHIPAAHLLPGDQLNMVFKCTIVSSGGAKAVVTSTGMNTKIGKIAGLMDTQRSENSPPEATGRINLITDGLTELALTAEPAEKDVIKRPPGRKEPAHDDLHFAVLYVARERARCAFGAFSNRQKVLLQSPMLFIILISVILQLAIVYLPLFQKIFKTDALALQMILLLMGAVILGMEIIKAIRRRFFS